MKRNHSRRSHSWWWDSHNIPKHSKWLAENLQVMDQAVKRMLRLIEEDADSFAKKAEMYYEKRPELVSTVEEFYRMYRALAERYNNVTGELNKSIHSDLQTHDSRSNSSMETEITESSSLEHKPEKPELDDEAVGFQNHTMKESSTSSSSSESDYEDESDMTASNDCLSNVTVKSDSEYHGSANRVENGNLDSEKTDSTTHAKTKMFRLRKELASANGRILDLEEEIARLTDELKMRESFLDESGGIEELRNQRAKDLQEQVTRLENEISTRENSTNELKSELATANGRVLVLKEEMAKLTDKLKMREPFLDEHGQVEENGDQRIKELQEQVVMLENEISNREDSVAELKSELIEVQRCFLEEKEKLVSDVSNLMEANQAEKNHCASLREQVFKLQADISEHIIRINELRDEICEASDRFAEEKHQLMGRISELLGSQTVFEKQISILHGEIGHLKLDKSERIMEFKRLEGEIFDRTKTIEGLNHDYETLKVECEMHIARNQDLSSKIKSLETSITSKDDQIIQMQRHLHSLHNEHLVLIKECEGIRNEMQELNGCVRELEEEVEVQKHTINDHAEGKREAIRQLCFSLEHYQEGYKRLRQALYVYKQPAITSR